MIFNHPPKSIFYTLSISTITALLLASCGGGGSSSTPAVETAAVAAISGTVKTSAVPSAPIKGVTVELDDLKEAKILTALTKTTNEDGEYTINPPSVGPFLLKFSGGTDLVSDKKFVTQFRSITVEEGKAVTLTPTILAIVDKTQSIDNAAGDTISSPDTSITGKNIEVTFPVGATDENITASLALLSGAEIPSKLPSQDGKTLLPVGAIALGISPDSAKKLNKAVEATVPVPLGLQKTTDFPVYFLSEDGKWGEPIGTGVFENNVVTFDITAVGTYMVMAVTPDAGFKETGATKSTKPVTPGEKIREPVTSTTTIEIPANVTGDAKEEVDAVIKSFIEQRNQAKADSSEESIIDVPNVATSKQASSELAAKLTCTASVIVTTQTFSFVFDFSNLGISGLGVVTIPVTVVITRTTVSCVDVPETGGTGGTT